MTRSTRNVTTTGLALAGALCLGLAAAPGAHAAEKSDRCAKFADLEARVQALESQMSQFAVAQTAAIDRCNLTETAIGPPGALEPRTCAKPTGEIGSAVMAVSSEGDEPRTCDRPCDKSDGAFMTRASAEGSELRACSKPIDQTAQPAEIAGDDLAEASRDGDAERHEDDARPDAGT